MNNQQELSTQSFSLPGVGSILKRSWQIYKVSAGTFLGIISLPLLFSFFLFFTSFFIKKINLTPTLFLLIFFIFLIIFFLMFFWPQVSLLFAIKEREERIGIKESYKKGWSKIISYFWILFLAGFIILGGIFFFIIPGIVFFIWFSLAPYILVSENLKGFSALIRSKQYIKGYWWKVFWRFLAIGIIWLLTFLIVSFPFFLLVGKVNKEIGDIINRTIYLLLLPFFVTCFFLVYEDLKRIKGNILFESPNRGTKTKYILTGILGLLIIPALMGSIVLFSFNKKTEKVKEIVVMAYMVYIQTKIEMIYSEQKKYSGLSCESSELTYFCDEIKNQIGKKPIIHTSSDNYCFYVKLPSGNYYCLDSQLKPSEKTSIFPGQSGYCDGVTFNCP